MQRGKIVAYAKGNLPMYVSEVTQFLADLKKHNPGIEAEQQKGRAIWWDKTPVSLDERARRDAATLPQMAYVYQIKG